ncbi:MAG: hypothetical protein JNL01_03480 [Bdellovibrionales bacterium]|nr:hypothetical protein [Bdellovibrionales bacterium]
MTEVVFQFNWSELFPIALPNGERIEVISYEEASQFIRDNTERCFSGRTVSHDPEANLAERREAFYRLVGDFFGLFSEGRLVGVFLGNISDWSSYYVRFAMILPDFQSGERYISFFRGVEKFLSSKSVARINGQISPMNIPSFMSVSKLGYRITGMEVTDRWGVLLNFSKTFRNDDAFTSRHFTNTKIPFKEAERGAQ